MPADAGLPPHITTLVYKKAGLSPPPRTGRTRWKHANPGVPGPKVTVVHRRNGAAFRLSRYQAPIFPEAFRGFQGFQAPIFPGLSGTQLPGAFKLSDTQLPGLAWINDEFMGV